MLSTEERESLRRVYWNMLESEIGQHPPEWDEQIDARIRPMVDVLPALGQGRRDREPHGGVDPSFAGSVWYHIRGEGCCPLQIAERLRDYVAP